MKKFFVCFALVLFLFPSSAFAYSLARVPYYGYPSPGDYYISGTDSACVISFASYTVGSSWSKNGFIQCTYNGYTYYLVCSYDSVNPLTGVSSGNTYYVWIRSDAPETLYGNYVYRVGALQEDQSPYICLLTDTNSLAAKYLICTATVSSSFVGNDIRDFGVLTSAYTRHITFYLRNNSSLYSIPYTQTLPISYTDTSTTDFSSDNNFIFYCNGSSDSGDIYANLVPLSLVSDGNDGAYYAGVMKYLALIYEQLDGISSDLSNSETHLSAISSSLMSIRSNLASILDSLSSIYSLSQSGNDILSDINISVSGCVSSDEFQEFSSSILDAISKIPSLSASVDLSPVSSRLDSIIALLGVDFLSDLYNFIIGDSSILPSTFANVKSAASSVFPFCALTEVYSVFSLLSSDSSAPSFVFDYDLSISGYSFPLDLSVDLSDWDSAASVLRWFFLVSWVIFLLYNIKKFIFVEV